jgi:hypothetical protein
MARGNAFDSGLDEPRFRQQLDDLFGGKQGEHSGLIESLALHIFVGAKREARQAAGLHDTIQLRRELLRLFKFREPDLSMSASAV